MNNTLAQKELSNKYSFDAKTDVWLNISNNSLSIMPRDISEKIKHVKPSIKTVWCWSLQDNYALVAALMFNDFKLVHKFSDKEATHIYYGIYKMSRTTSHRYRLTKKIRSKTKNFAGYDMTFIINAESSNTSSLDPQHLKHIMTSIYKLHETRLATSTPLYLFISEFGEVSYRYQSTYFNTRCYLMNIINNGKNIITDKTILYQALKSRYPKYISEIMPVSYTLDEFNNHQNIDYSKEVYLARPSGYAAGGRGIIVLDKPQKLDLVMKSMDTNRAYFNYIISKYIHNPLLFNKRKFHCRMFFIVSKINGIYRTFLCPNGRIVVAKLEYSATDFTNPDIHDTHLKSTDVDYDLPADLTPMKLRNRFITDTMPKINDIFIKVSSTLEPYCDSYPNALNCYEIFGCDIIVDNKYNPILLEINEHPGYKSVNGQKDKAISKYLFDYLRKSVFAYAFAFEKPSIDPLYQSHSSRNI